MSVRDLKNAKTRETRRANGRLRKDTLRWRYGITEERYAQMLHAQGGVCALCRRDRPGRWGQYHVDHDHETGRLRGLLCVRCNAALGFYQKVILPMLGRVEGYLQCPQ